MKQKRSVAKKRTVVRRKRSVVRQKRRSIRRLKDGSTEPNDPNKSNPVITTDDVVPDVNEKIIKLALGKQNLYSTYLLSHYKEGWKDCKSDNLKKIENYMSVLNEKFDEWKKNKCDFFELKSHKMHFNFKLRYTLRKCNGEKRNRIALNVMSIGFFNTDSYLKTLMSTIFGEDEEANKKIIKEFNEIDEIKFDMECNIFKRVINLFIGKLEDGQVLYLENVFNACWQSVLEDMKFKKCNNGNDYYLIKQFENDDDHIIKL